MVPRKLKNAGLVCAILMFGIGTVFVTRALVADAKSECLPSQLELGTMIVTERELNKNLRAEIEALKVNVALLNKIYKELKADRP